MLSFTNHINKINQVVRRKTELTLLEQLFQINYALYKKFEDSGTHRIPLNNLASFLIALIYNYGVVYKLDYSFLLLTELKEEDYNLSDENLTKLLHNYESETGIYLYDYLNNKSLYNLLADYIRTIIRLRKIKNNETTPNIRDIQMIVDLFNNPADIKELIKSQLNKNSYYKSYEINKYISNLYKIYIDILNKYAALENPSLMKFEDIFSIIIANYFIVIFYYKNNDYTYEQIATAIHIDMKELNKLAYFVIIFLQEFSAFFDESYSFTLLEEFEKNILL